MISNKKLKKINFVSPIVHPNNVDLHDNMCNQLLE